MSHPRTTQSAPPAARYDPVNLVNLAQYPITEPNSAAFQQLVKDCRQQIVSHGSCLLPAFLTAAGVAAAADEARASADNAYFCASTHNVYLLPDDPVYPADHPRRRRLPTDVGSAAYDQLPAGGALRTIYEWESVAEFIGAVLDRKPLYRFADPLGALSINVFRKGGRHAWHFDESEFTTTIMLQKSERGGDFEYVPGLREQPGNEDFAPVARVLDGDKSNVRPLALEPGTLSLFGGQRLMHQVTPVEGDRPRLVAVLCFAGEPGTVNSDAVRRLFWGRTG